MSSRLTHKSVVTRKPHQCVWCGQMISAGKTATYATGYDGGWWSFYIHFECDWAWGESKLDEISLMGEFYKFGCDEEGVSMLA